MKIAAQMKHSTLAQEYLNNSRLQWLVLIVVIILLASASKAMFAPLSERTNELEQQLSLLQRLELAAETEIDPQLTDTLKQNLTARLNSLPSASSASTAEARALADAEDAFGALLKRMRLNLVGSQSLALTQSELWSVRIDISGQLEEQQVPDLLALIDAKSPYRRAVSIQYSPKASGTINLVVDILLKGAPRE